VNSQNYEFLHQSTDGHITVKNTEVGVICINGVNITAEVVMAVNCLRSGCPAIQLLLDDCVDSIANQVDDNVRKVLCALEINNERFYVKSQDEKIYVITITRKVKS